MRPEYFGGEPGNTYDGSGNKEFDSAYAKTNRRLGQMTLKRRAKKPKPEEGDKAC